MRDLTLSIVQSCRIVFNVVCLAADSDMIVVHHSFRSGVHFKMLEEDSFYDDNESIARFL